MILLTDELKSDLQKVALAAADAARDVTLSYFRSPTLEAENKDADGFDPVTRADREAELAMRAVIQQARPDDGILGEELPTVTGRSGLIWVLDPIDGTRGFISGTPTWGTLISVATIGGPVFGIIDQPFIKERFIGGFGVAEVRGPHGTHPLRTRSSRALEAATLLSTFPEVGTKTEYRAFRALSERVRLTRYGMDCYGYALLAAGQVDLVVEAGLNAYDIQAPISVIQAAGGIVSNWQGGAAYSGGQVIAAANADVHAVALSILQDALHD
ncbi:inositol monophosphatase [Loktanella sp. 3ANDIMAR09]|uniref:inositol monophosphatase family protein n=1 Tax=Loktanella sp. 3ANDIMAR09 TaxID=1225657 RepID=UPI0006F85E65|nr:inositol monophosphatase family protein [Loktanella sp. 3ANDIMAR09]KQI67349.1 inositol monophosphatase [Loktanella sp. 3ANDIMAR09]